MKYNLDITEAERGELVVALIDRHKELLERRRIYERAVDLPRTLADNAICIAALRSLADKLSIPASMLATD